MASRRSPENGVIGKFIRQIALVVYDRTGNIKLVSETLGHAIVETTARYLHPSKKGLAEHVTQRKNARKGEADAAVAESRHTFWTPITLVQ